MEVISTDPVTGQQTKEAGESKLGLYDKVIGFRDLVETLHQNKKVTVIGGKVEIDEAKDQYTEWRDNALEIMET